MTPTELRDAREALQLTPAEMAVLTEVDVSSVYKWERDSSAKSSRPAPARVARLIRAYLAGFRPGDWPGHLLVSKYKPLPAEVRK